jgi:hypothetical protein
VSDSLISQPVLSEPFGQRGVRQYLFSAVACSSLVTMLLSAAMWIRSYHLEDAFFLERPNASWRVASIYGRILIGWGNGSPEPAAGPEWSYDRRRVPDYIIDAWQPSIYKSMGIEWRHRPLNRNWGSRGGWLRIRWPLVVAVAAILPMVRFIGRRREKRRESASIN